KAAAPDHVVALGQFHRRIDLPHRLRHKSAHVAVSHTPLDRNPPDVPFAEDLTQSFGLFQLGELGNGNTFATGRADREVAQAFKLILVPRKPHSQVEPALSFKNLGDDMAPRSRLDGVLDVLDVDTVAGRGASIHGDQELWLTDKAIVVKVVNTADMAEDSGDLLRFGFKHKQIRSIEFNGQLAFHARQRLIDVVLDRLGEVCGDARNGRQRRVHGLDQFFFVLDPPLVAGFKADVEFGVVWAVWIGTIIWGSVLRYDGADFGELQHALADIVHIGLGALEGNADGKLDPQPNIALVQLWQKLFAEEREDNKREHKQCPCAQYRNEWPADAEPQGRVVSVAEPTEQRALAFRRRL